MRFSTTNCQAKQAKKVEMKVQKNEPDKLVRAKLNYSVVNHVLTQIHSSYMQVWL